VKLAAVICNFCISFSVNSCASGISLFKKETGILKLFGSMVFLSEAIGKFDLSFLDVCLGCFFLKMFQNIMMENSCCINKVRLADCWEPSDCGSVKIIKFMLLR